MGNSFNPGDPRYQRKIQVLTLYASTLVGFQTLMIDYGKREHVFSPLQRYFDKKIDLFYEITDEELYSENPPPPQPPKYSFLPQITFRVVNKSDLEKVKGNN